MRSNVVTGILLLAIGLAGGILLSPLLTPGSHSQTDNEVPAKPTVQATTTSFTASKEDIPSATATATTPAPTNQPATSEPESEHEIQVATRNSELMNLAMNDDAASFNTIWSELSNPDKEIRAGALAAVVQFGDRSAIPGLRALAARTDNAAEKSSIEAAADQLALPTILEIHPAQRAKSMKRPASPTPAH